MTYQLEYKRNGSGFYENGLAGETLGARKLVYLDTNGYWRLADADDVNRFPVVGITLESIPVNNYGGILTKGYIGDSSWGWATIGGPIYATSTQGELSQTAPVDGVKSQVVGIVKESDLILFDTGLNFRSTELTVNENNWDDLRFPASSVRLGGAAPATFQAYKSGGVLAFADNQTQYIYVVAQMPHTWAEGTDIEAHLHWTTPVNGAGLGAENVKWDLTYSWSNINAAIPNASTDTVTVDVQTFTADMQQYTSFGTITGTGKTYSSCLIISLSRDSTVANDYANPAYLIEFDIHYKKNRFGTITIPP